MFNAKHKAGDVTKIPEHMVRALLWSYVDQTDMANISQVSDAIQNCKDGTTLFVGNYEISFID